MFDWLHKTWRLVLQNVLFLLTDKYQVAFSMILMTVSVYQLVVLSHHYQEYLQYVDQQDSELEDAVSSLFRMAAGPPPRDEAYGYSMYSE